MCVVHSVQEPGKAVYGMTAFNMNDEKDEGHFDENGAFVWNAEDKKVQEEAWLEDISEEQMDEALNAKVSGMRQLFDGTTATRE